MTISLELQIVRECAFGIVDAAMIEHLPHGLCIEPLVPKKLTQSAHLMPALIDLRRTPKESLNALLREIEELCVRGESPSVSLFIKTDSGITELAQHWNAMQVAEPQRGRKLWVRLHDPRVLHQILRLLNLTQRRTLFGRSHEFIYWVGGKWFAAAREVPSVLSHRTLENSGNVQYGGLQKWDWNRIERIGLVNRGLLGAQINDAATLTDQSALAEQLIERAVMQYKLSEPADLVEFAVRGMQTNPVFDECDNVARAIRPDPNLAEKSNLSDRFALIDTQIWNSLRQPINSSGNMQDDHTKKMRVL